jgi:hypothetical protein
VTKIASYARCAAIAALLSSTTGDHPTADRSSCTKPVIDAVIDADV